MSGLETLAGKIAVVTGGASGIGRGIARQMIAEGATVVIADIEDQALQATAAEIGAIGIRTDVSDLASVQALADAVVSRFGTVHVICNNAGVGPKAKIADATIDDWTWMINVNLWGVIHGINVFLPILRASPDGGHVVNTASAGGLVVGPTMGIYSTTKFGVVAMTEALAIELAMEQSRVGATVFCPGTVRTNLHTGSRNRPSSFGDIGAVDVDLMNNPLIGQSDWMAADDVGPIVTAAIRRGDLFVTTHPDLIARVEARTARIAAGFARSIPG